jgi:large subunit ribosomal protein L30
MAEKTKKKDAAMVRITLKRSLIGQKPKTRARVRGLGLRRIGQTVEHKDSDSLRGMLLNVQHLVEVDEG